MATIKKPDFKHVKCIIKDIQISQKNLNSLYTKKQNYEKLIREYYTKLQAEAAQKELCSIDIEVLNTDKEGIRISALKTAGIHTISQVLSLSPAQLCSIDGIGESMAQKIITNAKAIEENTVKNCSISLSPNEKSQNATNLLQNLGLLLKEQPVLNQASALYETHSSSITQAIVDSKPGTGLLRWLFANATAKEKALQSITILQRTLDEGLLKKSEDLCKQYRQTAFQRFFNVWEDFALHNAAYYALLESILGSNLSSNTQTGTGNLPEDLLKQIQSFEPDLRLLKANLRNYQLFGTKYILHQQKVLLGDEMGLGKTMQAIASFCHLAATGKKYFLVVCPLSVVVNWTREIQSQSQLAAIEIYGSDRTDEVNQWATEGGVAITTFETLNKITIPDNISIDMMVVDEAHYIKNPEAIRTRTVLAASRKAKHILLMSGTPLENKVEEMNFLIECLQPQIAFHIKNMKQLTQAEEYKKSIAPVYLRRVREDVLKELPELIEKEQWCIMNEKERCVYRDSLMEDNFMAARQLSWNMADIQDSTKAQRLMEICNEMKESGRKIIIFSFFKNTLQQVRTLLGECCVGIIDGSLPSQQRQQLIDEFTESKAGSALVCQIQAGGVGLNIQAASVVIFCEPQIKPSMETQAIARAYRMGQMESVIVHRLLMQDTIDERVMDILKNKTELFDNFADESVIGDAAIKQMMAEERQKLQ